MKTLNDKTMCISIVDAHKYTYIIALMGVVKSLDNYLSNQQMKDVGNHRIKGNMI